MKLKQLIALTALGLSTVAGSAHADNGFYIGGSIGNSELGFENTDTDFDLDDSDTGYKVFGGFKFTILAVEAGYVDFGNISEAGNRVDLSGYSAFGLLNLGIGPVDLFGKVGGFAWESDFKAGDIRDSEDGFDPAVGIGAGLSFGSFSVRGEYEYFDISDFDDVSMLSIGATYTF